MGATAERGAERLPRRWIAAILGGLAVAYAAGGLWFALAHRPARRAATLAWWEQELDARAEIRRLSLGRWIAGDVGMARTIAANPGALAAAEDRLAARPTDRAEAHLTDELAVAVRQLGYRSAALLDARGDLIAHAGRGADGFWPEAATRAIADGTAAVRFAHGADGAVVAFAVAPLRGAGGRRVGACLLTRDPTVWVYPILASAVAARGGSGEAELFAQAEGGPVPLSPLAGGIAPLSPWRPADPARSPASEAAAGVERFGEYVDYRGRPVLAVTRSLNGGAWGLVVKVDEAEALAPLRAELARSAILYASLLGAGGLAALLFVGVVSRAQSSSISERNAQIAVLLDQANDPILVLTLDGRIVASNRRAQETYGRSESDLLGLTTVDLRPPGHAPDAAAALRRIVETRGLVFETLHRHADGTAFPVEVSARVSRWGGEDAVVAIVRDISERRRAEEQIQRLNRALTTLYRVQAAIVRARSRQPLLDEVCSIFVEAGEATLAWIATVEADGSGRIVAAAGMDPSHPEGPRGESVFAGSPTTRAAAGGETTVYQDDGSAAEPGSWRERYRQAGLRSVAAFPLRTGERVTGALTVGTAEAGFFGQEEVALYEELVAGLGLALAAFDAEAERERLAARHRVEQDARRAVADAPDTAAGVEALLAVLGTGLGFEVAVLRTFDSSRDVLCTAGRWHDGSERARRFADTLGADTPLEASPIAPRLAGHAVTWVEDVAELATGRGRVVVERALACGISTCVAVPLVSESQTLGYLALFNSARRTPDADVAAVLESLDAPVGQFLGRARAEAELRAERNALAERVAERTAELREVNAELRRASRMKDEFLASMSHELRTPLNAILGLAEAIQEGIYGPPSAGQARALQTIEESGRHLLSLINDVLDVSKIEAGKLTIDVAALEAAPVCESALRLVKESALKKGVALESAVLPGLALRADARRLKQMLVNLLSNAVKSTPRDGRVGLEAATDGDWVRFTVWDTGVGIAPEDVPRLFQPFTQLDNRLAREATGTGLGLALVRRLAQLHGGGASLESELGRGTRVTVRLPAGHGEATAPAPMPPAALPTSPAGPAAGGDDTPLPTERRPLVLLAEDSEANVQTFGDYLRSVGFDVIVARDGEQAVALAVERRPAVILMDVQMPRVDGLEATRRIRAIAGFDAVPIVALTALAMTGDRERCLAAGASAYLAKPVRLRELGTLVASLSRHAA